MVEAQTCFCATWFYNAEPGSTFNFAHPILDNTCNIPHILSLSEPVDKGLLCFLNKLFAKFILIVFANVDFLLLQVAREIKLACYFLIARFAFDWCEFSYSDRVNQLLFLRSILFDEKFWLIIMV